MTFAHAAPESNAGERPNLGIFADPIAQFASPGEEAVGDLLMQAMSLIGVAYRFGGTSPETGLDCSGFIQYIFRKSLRVNLPRTSAEMARMGRMIEPEELVPGDLVFYNTRGFQYSHVGLYLGGNKFIHSPRTGKSVEIVNMGSSYWKTRFNGARRIPRAGVPEWKDTARTNTNQSVRPARKAKADEPAAKPGKRASESSATKSRKKRGAERDAPVSKRGGKAESKKPARKKKRPE